MPFERAPDMAACAVEQDPLIAGRDVQRVAHFVGAVAMDVAQRDDGPLRVRKLCDGRRHELHGLSPGENGLRQLGPVRWGSPGDPLPGIARVRALKAAGVYSRLVITGLERGERDTTGLSHAPGHGGVR